MQRICIGFSVEGSGVFRARGPRFGLGLRVEGTHHGSRLGSTRRTDVVAGSVVMGWDQAFLNMSVGEVSAAVVMSRSC